MNTDQTTLSKLDIHQIARDAYLAEALIDSPSWKHSEVSDMLLCDLAAFLEIFAGMIIAKHEEMVSKTGDQEVVEPKANWYQEAFEVLSPLRWHLAEVVDSANTANILLGRPVIPTRKVEAAEKANAEADEFFGFAAVKPSKDACCNSPSHEDVMMRAHALCPSDMSQSVRMRWIADYYELNRPT